MKKVVPVLIAVMIAVGMSACSGEVPDYSEWKVSDWKDASQEIQVVVLEDFTKQLGIDFYNDAEKSDNACVALGNLLVKGHSIGEIIEMLRKDPNLLENSGNIPDNNSQTFPDNSSES